MSQNEILGSPVVWWVAWVEGPPGGYAKETERRPREGWRTRVGGGEGSHLGAHTESTRLRVPGQVDGPTLRPPSTTHAGTESVHSWGSGPSRVKGSVGDERILGPADRGLVGVFWFRSFAG